MTRLLCTASLILLGTSAFGQSALRERFDSDRTFDRQSTIQNWVDPGSIAMKYSPKSTPADPAAQVGGKMAVVPPQTEESWINFTGSLEASMNYDTNAFQNPSERDDWHLDYALSLGAEMNLGSWVVAPSFVLGGQHYDDYDSDLSGNLLGFSLAVEPVEQGPITLTLLYDSEWYYSEGFDDGAGSAHSPSVRLGHRFYFIGAANPANGRPAIKSLSLAVNLTSNYQWADDSSKDSTRGTLAGKLLYVATDRLSFSASSGLTYRYYTNTSSDRDIWMVKVGAAVDYVIKKTTDSLPLLGDSKLAARLGVNYTNADDTVPTRDFDQVVAFASIAVSF